jgi:hypothetical protein
MEQFYHRGKGPHNQTWGPDESALTQLMLDHVGEVDGSDRTIVDLGKGDLVSIGVVAHGGGHLAGVAVDAVFGSIGGVQSDHSRGFYQEGKVSRNPLFWFYLLTPPLVLVLLIVVGVNRW